MFEDIAPLFGRFDKKLETFADLCLASELTEHRWSQRDFKSRIRRGRGHLRLVISGWCRSLTFYCLNGEPAYCQVFGHDQFGAAGLDNVIDLVKSIPN